MSKEMQKVERAAMKVATAQAALESVIREAHTSGLALRKIADVAGMSHESVRRIVSR